MSTQVRDSVLAPKGYQQIAASTLANATTLTVPDGARYALIVPEQAGVRYRDDGTSPTSTVGMPMAAGDSLWYTGRLQSISFIRTDTTTVLNILYYG